MVDRTRLAKLLGMLGSTHDGEVLAAARQAERLRQAAGATWHDILDIEPDDDEIIFVLLRQHRHLMTEWERHFVASLAGWRSDISERQREYLIRILERCRRAEEWAAEPREAANV